MAGVTLLRYPRGTEETITAYVTDTDGQPLTGTVEISVHRGTAYDWRPAEWTSPEGVTREATTVAPILFDAATFPRSSYTIAARLDGEVIVNAGTVVLT